MRRILVIITFSFLLLAPTKRVGAQQDSAVTLSIRILDHAPSFRVGEVIPLELVFSASGPESYEIGMRNYDRSGRLDIEQFHVTPTGRDPLKDYYERGPIMLGGLSATPRVLNDAPQTRRNDLNEWIALDNPGHYKLYVTSGRVIRRAASKAEPVELRSNALEFDVIAADASWQQQTIGAAISIVDDPSSSLEERRSALRNLRFLNSAASVPELVRQLGKLPDGQRWDCVAGLWSSPERSLVVRTLEQHMSDPDIALNQEYVWALTSLKFHADHGAPSPYPKDDPQQQQIWQDRAQSEQAELLALHQKLLGRTATLAPSKTGSAKAETVRTLLQEGPANRDGGKLAAALPEEDLAAAFVALSPEQQYGMISTFGNWLKVQAMVEPLKRLLQQQIPQQLQRDEALRLLYEVSPDEGTPRILEEIRRPHVYNGMLTVRPETLSLLPNETLPQFDDLLARRLEQEESHTFDLDAQLVGRYATASILERVKAVYAVSAGEWSCDAEDGFVLYFLRVEPDYGVKRIAASPGSCLSHSLSAVIRMNRWREIEPAIIKNLNDRDLDLARDAAETLAKYSGPQAEAAMWKRLRNFHDQWAEREQDLAYRPKMSREANQAKDFQFGLVEALGRAQGWVITDQQVTELENLTLGEERQNVKQWHWNSPLELTITGLSDVHFHVDINHQYASGDVASLRKKLAQFPAGTSFRLTNTNLGSPAQLEPVMRAIYDTAAEHGLTIQSQP
jgi:hypothetical protein